jgi:hypothetical protein
MAKRIADRKSTSPNIAKEFGQIIPYPMRALGVPKLVEKPYVKPRLDVGKECF